MNHLHKHPLSSAVLVNIALFSIVVFWCFPIFHSGDDVFLLYLASGGFGNAPTELLHYHYGMHPYLGWVLKELFIHFTGTNWYAVLLYALHFAACTAMAYQHIKKNPGWHTLAAYALLFLAIESRFLLQPSFTNTAMVTAIAGAMLLLANRLWIAALFFVISAMLRLHLLAPVALIAAPFIIMSWKRFRPKQFATAIAATALLIVALTWLQQQYYINRIPAWQQEEAYRQATIGYYNSPKIIHGALPDSIRLKAAALNRGMLWDKAFLSANEIRSIQKAVGIGAAWQYDDLRERLYWILMENRLALLALLLLCWWRYATLVRAEKKAAWASLLLYAGLCGGLLLFIKLPAYLTGGGLLLWLALLGTCGGNPSAAGAAKQWLFIAGTALLLSWSAIRLYKTSRWNRQQHANWQCAYGVVSSQPDKLFIVTDDKFPMDYFHVWSDPRGHRLPNLLYRDHFQNNVYQPAYDRFGIRSPAHLAGSRQVLFTGSDSLLTDYFRLSARKNVVAVPADTSACIRTYTLSLLP